jgi:protein-S-isoprenylcysteine O-methyltransferase Ste14
MNKDILIRLLIFLFMAINFTISGYYRRKANQATGKTDFSEENQFLLLLRNIGALLMYGSILAYLVYPPILSWADMSLSPTVRFSALGIMVLMVPAFYWLFSNLDKNVTPTVTIREEHALVTSGPYRWIRHPLYTFGFLNILAVAVAADNWFILMVSIVTFIPLAMRTPQEEGKLIKAFGEKYKQYMQVTGRYLPRSLRGAKDL